MATETKINWESCFISGFAGSGPAVEIKDDCETYCATIPEEMTAREMAEEFARTYDFNGEPGCDISCSCNTFVDAGDSWDLEDGFSFRVTQFTEPASNATGFATFC